MARSRASRSGGGLCSSTAAAAAAALNRFLGAADSGARTTAASEETPSLVLPAFFCPASSFAALAFPLAPLASWASFFVEPLAPALAFLPPFASLLQKGTAMGTSAEFRRVSGGRKSH